MTLDSFLARIQKLAPTDQRPKSNSKTARREHRQNLQDTGSAYGTWAEPTEHRQCLKNTGSAYRIQEVPTGHKECLQDTG